MSKVRYVHVAQPIVAASYSHVPEQARIRQNKSKKNGVFVSPETSQSTYMRDASLSNPEPTVHTTIHVHFCEWYMSEMLCDAPPQPPVSSNPLDRAP